MYGVERVPNDVDIIAFTNNLDAEEIKDHLVSINPKFFLVASRNRINIYQVLHYRLYSPRYSGERSCKVDILIPGILDIPWVPQWRITYTHIPGVPVMPMLALLLLKLQGWDDHRNSTRRDFQQKQYVDAEDIIELLQIVLEEEDVHLTTERWMPAAFVRAGRARVNQFMTEFPDTGDHWSELGF